MSTQDDDFKKARDALNPARIDKAVLNHVNATVNAIENLKLPQPNISAEVMRSIMGKVDWTKNLLPNQPWLSSDTWTKGFDSLALQAIRNAAVQAQGTQLQNAVKRLLTQGRLDLFKYTEQPQSTSTTEFISGSEGPAHRGSKQVWHYTSDTVLESILSNNIIWASNPSNLNDSTELTHGINVIRDAVENLPKNGTRVRDVLEIVLDDESIEEEKENVYYLSASTSQDSLTQWRTYSTKSGVAIGLLPQQELLAIQQPTELVADDEPPYQFYSPSTRWYDVIYTPTKQKRLAKRFIDRASDDIESLEHRDATQLIGELRNLSIILASTMKKPAFSDEKEVRWISTSSSGKPGCASYELTRSGFAPVLKLSGVSPVKNFPDHEGTNGDTRLTRLRPALLPIGGLRCAPTSRPMITKIMAGVLKQYGYTKASKDVSKSKAPFTG